MSDSILWDIEVPTPKPASSPSDALTALPQAAVTSGALVALPTPSRAGAPDLPVPMPKQRRGGDVKDALYGPVPAVLHLANAHPVITPAYTAPEGGDAA